MGTLRNGEQHASKIGRNMSHHAQISAQTAECNLPLSAKIQNGMEDAMGNTKTTSMNTVQKPAVFASNVNAPSPKNSSILKRRILKSTDTVTFTILISCINITKTI